MEYTTTLSYTFAFCKIIAKIFAQFQSLILPKNVSWSKKEARLEY